MYELLIVDDEGPILNGICNYYPWDELGFRVTGFSRAEDVLACLRAGTCADVVMTDISMPGMNGLELAAALRAEFDTVRIVLLSGYAEFEYAQTAVRLGVIEYMLKPIKAADIKSVFGAIRRQLEAESEAVDCSDTYQEGYYEKIVRLVKEYIDQNLSNATLEEAAQSVNLSASHLSGLFKAGSGQTFSEYLMQGRMEQAKQLLLHLDYKTYHVAELLGYESPQNFARAFKLYYGITPREFKKAGKP